MEITARQAFKERQVVHGLEFSEIAMPRWRPVSNSTVLPKFADYGRLFVGGPRWSTFDMAIHLDRLRGRLREHRHFVIVLTLLTLAVTFPTIVQVFRTDIFWHPGGEHADSFIKLWDLWYGNLFLSGQADRFYTDLMFYPDGVSLFTTHSSCRISLS